MMDNHHSKKVLFAIRSRAAPCGPSGRTSCGFPPKHSFSGASVGYAAEYLTLAYARHNMCLFCSMPMRILYHIWGVRLITATIHCASVSAVVVSIDLHSSKPRFSVQLVETYEPFSHIQLPVCPYLISLISQFL